MRYDREQKNPVYARAGIQETWLVNLIQNVLEVYRDPVDGAYRTRLTFGPGEQIAPLVRPDKPIAVAGLIPQR